MSLADEYQRQRAWRDWPSILGALPRVQGQLILDLGCGIGEQAAALAARGARVVGVDADEELLREARTRRLLGVEFLAHDLRALPDLGLHADGLWCSFAAAYFPDLPAALSSWAEQLAPNAWIALTEVDDLFAHEPLGAEAKALLDAYARDALAARQYDFHMGRKLGDYLGQCGFRVSKQLLLADRELVFDGPALPEVVVAWERRFERLARLRALAGTRFDRVRDQFLRCLESPGHRSGARVFCLIGVRSPTPTCPACAVS